VVNGHLIHTSTFGLYAGSALTGRGNANMIWQKAAQAPRGRKLEGLQTENEHRTIYSARRTLPGAHARVIVVSGSPPWLRTDELSEMLHSDLRRSPGCNPCRLGPQLPVTPTTEQEMDSEPTKSLNENYNLESFFVGTSHTKKNEMRAKEKILEQAEASSHSSLTLH